MSDDALCFLDVVCDFLVGCGFCVDRCAFLMSDGGSRMLMVRQVVSGRCVSMFVRGLTVAVEGSEVKRGGVCVWVEFDGVDPLFFDKLKLHVDCYLANKVW